MDWRSHGKKPQREQKGETMRLVRFLFGIVLLSVFGVTLMLFLAQNWRTTQVDFFGLEYTIHLAWLLAGAAAFGVLGTLALLLPGRLAAMVYTWSLERELRQWEQDLSKLHAQRERLLSRHEQLLEAHERVLQAHHRLVGEHSQVVADRDQIRAELAHSAAARTSSVHQPARVSSVPRIAIVSPVSPVSPVSQDGRPVIPAAVRPRAHDVHGGKGSTSAPRWAVPCPPGRPVPAPLARTSGEVPQTTTNEQVAREATREPPILLQPVVIEQRLEKPAEPAPAAMPLPPAEEPPTPRVVPRTVPILSTEPVASAPAPAPTAPAATPTFSLRSLRYAAERTIISMTPRLVTSWTWLYSNLAGMVTAFAAKRASLEARLAYLKQSVFSDGLPLDSSRSTPRDLPSGDDRSEMP